MRNTSVIACLVLFLGAVGAFAQNAKPSLKVAADGFPIGQETPEGAACDLARAFITHDASLFTKICIKPYQTESTAQNEYGTFLRETAQSMKDDATKRTPSPYSPKAIGKVFAARHLTLDGPASYGYAAFGFRDVMFVDVGCYLQDGSRCLNRTLVIEDTDGKWYVHPDPTISPLLCAGLNDEKPSQTDFSETYNVQK